MRRLAGEQFVPSTTALSRWLCSRRRRTNPKLNVSISFRSVPLCTERESSVSSVVNFFGYALERLATLLLVDESPSLSVPLRPVPIDRVLSLSAVVNRSTPISVTGIFCHGTLKDVLSRCFVASYVYLNAIARTATFLITNA